MCRGIWVAPRRRVLRPLLASVVCLSTMGCTLGLEQDFALEAGPSVSDGENDVLFTLTNVGGNAPGEAVRVQGVAR